MASFARSVWRYIVACYFHWWFGIVGGALAVLTTYEWFAGKTIPVPPWFRVAFAFAALILAHLLAYRDLDEKLAAQQQAATPKRAELWIHSRGGRYVVHPDNRMFVELHLAIENKGEKNSVIDRFDLRVQQTGKEYMNISPTFKSGVHGRKGLRVFDPNNWLTQRGMTTVPAVDKIGPGVLLFYVPDLPPPGCSEVNCTLTIFDTEENQVSSRFVLSEA